MSTMFSYHVDNYNDIDNTSNSILDDKFHRILENHEMVLELGKDTPEILYEGLNDIYKDATEFFKELAESITSFVKKYLGDINKNNTAINSFLLKYENEISQMNPSFTINMYNYSIGKNIPDVTVIQKEMHDYVYNLNRLDTLSISDVDAMSSYFKLENIKNTLRATVLQEVKPITKDKYDDACFAIFRSGMMEPKKTQITKANVNFAIEQYKYFSTDLMTSVKLMYADIYNTLASIQKYFNQTKSTGIPVDFTEIRIKDPLRITGSKISPTGLRGGHKYYSPEELLVLNKLVSFKLTQFKLISDLIITAFKEKIKAIKEAMDIYRTIIMKAVDDEIKK